MNLCKVINGMAAHNQKSQSHALSSVRVYHVLASEEDRNLPQCGTHPKLPLLECELDDMDNTALYQSSQHGSANFKILESGYAGIWPDDVPRAKQEHI